MQRNSPELPTLDAGVTLLDSHERTTGALQSLVLDHVLFEGGRAVWVDARGKGTTQPMARLAPSLRVLDRIDVARAFTPWQHQSLLRDLTDEVTDDTALVVLPAFDAFYRADEVRRQEGARMLAEGMALVAELAADSDVPVLLTRRRADDFTWPLETAADEVLTCTMTALGPRFSGDQFETLVYPVEDGMVQTTLTFWSRVLSDRHPAVTEFTAAERTGVNVLGSH